MTDDRMVLIELVEKQADVDLVREMLAFAAERIMEFERDAIGPVDRLQRRTRLMRGQVPRRARTPLRGSLHHRDVCIRFPQGGADVVRRVVGAEDHDLLAGPGVRARRAEQQGGRAAGITVPVSRNASAVSPAQSTLRKPLAVPAMWIARQPASGPSRWLLPRAVRGACGAMA